jgi:hypothetical protein
MEPDAMPNLYEAAEAVMVELDASLVSMTGLLAFHFYVHAEVHTIEHTRHGDACPTTPYSSLIIVTSGTGESSTRYRL